MADLRDIFVNCRFCVTRYRFRRLIVLVFCGFPEDSMEKDDN
jgi:hypothetical protein